MSKKTTLEEGLLGALGGAALGGGLGYVGGAAAGGALAASKGVKDAATSIGSKVGTAAAANKALQAGQSAKQATALAKGVAQKAAGGLAKAADATGIGKNVAQAAVDKAAAINPAATGAKTTANYLSKASAAGAKKAAGIVSNLPKTGRAVGAATGAVVGGVVGDRMTKKEGKQIRNMKPVHPKSKGGIGGDGGNIMDSFNAAYNNIMEYYTAPKKKLKEEDEEKEGMSNAAKTAAALGISVTALLAMSPSARAAAMGLGKKAIGSVKSAGDKIPKLFKDGKPITYLGKGPTP